MDAIAQILRKMKARKCQRCKAEFKPNTEWQKFCGEKCRIRTKTERRAQLIRHARKLIEQAAEGA